MDQMILVEFQTVFKFCQNGFGNHLEGLLPGMRWKRIVACHRTTDPHPQQAWHIPKQQEQHRNTMSPPTTCK